MAVSLAIYNTTSYPFPKDDINPADKDELWGKKWCEAIYSKWKQGKALSLDTPIPTPTGYSTMGDLKIGDYVLGRDGNPTKVTYVTPVQNNRECYKITFSDNEIIIADAEHLWLVKKRSNGKEIVLTTSELLKQYKYHRPDKDTNEYLLRVPMNKPIILPTIKLPIDPYVLGLWLGDGGSHSPSFTVDIKDLLLYDYVKSIYGEYKIHVDNRRSNVLNISFAGKCRGYWGDTSKFKHDLKELGVFGNKHIPTIYLRSGKEQRLALLQGLMDTDGSVSNGQCEFSQRRKNISDSFCELLGSLGIKYSRIIKTPTINGIPCNSVHRIQFYTDKTIPCFKLKRKYDKLKDNLKWKEYKSIINIERVDSVPVKCISVDNNEELYLCGNHFTVTHNTCIPFSQVNEIRNLRALAEGRQNILQYQKILMDDSSDKTEITGYMNINWDIFSVMPKFLRVVEGMMEQTEHQVVATAVDPSASDEKENAKLDMTFRMAFKQQLDQIQQSLGLGKSSDYVPDTVEEMNLYEGAGGFKLSKEIKIEQGLDYTFYISDWKEIKKKLIRDACVINIMATKDYVDKYCNKVHIRYVDPEYFIGQYSKFWDHRNMEYAGEIIQVSISELRTLVPDINEAVLRQLATEYNGIFGNLEISDLTYNMETKTANYDGFLVHVTDVEWKSVNSEYHTTRKTSAGNEFMYEEEWGKVYNTEKKSTSQTDIKMVYKCKWIIGTDHVYDFGMQYDIPRPGKKEVELSFHLYKLPFRSLVSLCEPCLHQMALAFYRLQNAIAKAAPPGIAIEFTALQNMKLGGNKMEPLELLRIREQTGNLIFKATTHKGVPNTPGGYRPIQELAGGIGAQLNEFVSIFQMNTEQIREFTGINQIADASQPNPEQSVGGSEMALAATNNALRPIYSGYITIKEKTAKNVSLRLQLLIKHDKEAYTGYMPVLGKLGVQIISVGADVVDADYFIKYEAKPTDKRKAIILQAAQQAMNPDRDGIIGIELADFLMIERYLEGGNLKYAEAFLNYKSKKNKEKQKALQQENMQLDSQREQGAIKVKSELVAQESRVKSDEEIRVYRAKKEIDEEFAQKQHQRDLQKIGTQSSLNMVADAAKAQSANVPVPATV